MTPLSTKHAWLCKAPAKQPWFKTQAHPKRREKLLWESFLLTSCLLDLRWPLPSAAPRQSWFYDEDIENNAHLCLGHLSLVSLQITATQLSNATSWQTMLPYSKIWASLIEIPALRVPKHITIYLNWSCMCHFKQEVVAALVLVVYFERIP